MPDSSFRRFHFGAPTGMPFRRAYTSDQYARGRFSWPVARGRGWSDVVNANDAYSAAVELLSPELPRRTRWARCSPTSVSSRPVTFGPAPGTCSTVIATGGVPLCGCDIPAPADGRREYAAALSTFMPWGDHERCSACEVFSPAFDAWLRGGQSRRSR